MSVTSAAKSANLVATDDTLEIECGGYGTVGIQLAGTWTGTVTFEVTVDHGTWQTLNVTKTNSTSQVTTATGNGQWVGSVAGLLAVRARFSTASSGTVQARLLVAGTGGGSGSGGGGAGGGGTSSDFGAAFPAEGTAIGFDDGTNMVPGNMNADGGIEVHVTNGGGGTSSAFGDPFPADGTAIGIADPDGDMHALSAETLDYDTGGGTVAQTVLGIALPGAGGPVAGGTSTNPIRVDPTGTTTQPVSAASLPLPTGAATSANQSTEITHLATLAGAVSGTEMQVDVLTSALPTGAATLAEQQSQTTALQIIDDWDESDRAKVNPIVGQAGIQGGAGAVSANTTRVAIATDANTVAVSSKTVYTRPAYGTAQTVFNSSTDIAAGNFSAAGTDFTNNDGTIGAALYADAMIEIPDWAAAPVAGTTVDLYGTLINTDGTDDDTDAPSGTAAGGARYFGSWIIAAADALQRRTITISLAGVQSGFTPYIKNGTAQNMNNDGGTNMVVKITPWNTAQVG